MKYFLVFLFFPTLLFAQERTLRKFTVFGRMGGGVGYSFPGMKKNSFTDDLIYFNGKGGVVQLFGAILYKEKWGLCVNFQSRDASKNNFGRFNSGIESQYPTSNYYVNYSTRDPSSYDQSGIDYPDVETVSAGILYNFGHGKLRWMPRLMAGFSDVIVSNRYVEIKEKNSNDYIQIYYDQGKSDNNHFLFTMQTGVSIMYLIYRGIGVNLDVNYDHFFVFPGSMDFTVSTYNSSDASTTFQKIRYSQAVGQFSLTVGLNIYIRWYKKVKVKGYL